MGNEKILVVEDEGIVAEDIKLSLQRLGFVVPATAASGEEAIRKTEEYHPDLVLMDIILQGEMDGIEAAKKISTHFNIPVVYLTAYAGEGMLERAKITEPIGYILKPYTEKELNATIEMALYQYKSGRRRRELMYREILESMPDPIIITNTRGLITQVNIQTEKVFGYNRDELIGKPIETLIPERFREAHIGHRQGYYSNPRTRPMGVCLNLYGRRKDGSEFPLDISLSPVDTDPALPAGGEGLLVISDIRDITDRKEIEKTLKKNYNLLNTTIEGTPDAIFVKDLHGRYILINSSGAGLIGRSVEEIIGKDDTELFEPEAARKIMEDDLRIITSGGTKTYEEELESKTGIRRTYLTTKVVYCDHEGKVIGLIGIARDITERKQDEKQIHHLAYYDLLTDLPNRLMLRDYIDRAITSARKEIVPFALLVVNLHRFKEINNTLGYQKGDIVLQQVGKRLKTILPEAFSIARTGGDEFGVLILNTDANIAVLVAEKIARGLEEPVFVEGFSLDLAVSVGSALYPGHGEDADTLIRRAHIAMHAAKQTESGYAIYTPEYDQFIPERLALMGELRSAIGQNQLFLVYQPKIDLKTGRTLGVEALVRWQHPETGLIPPDKFISLAEESGLIKQLTFWVLREALRQSRSWSQAGLEVSVAVNLSIKNLRTPLLLDQIRGLLSTWGVDPRRLRFEITESLIMADPKLTIEILTQLTLMGICFSIDDFGTGYSSLRYLQTLPVDEIKIDKSFVLNMMTDESSMKIVRSTIELAHSLGLKVTAEGVESREVFDKLTELGCDAAQGYFISRPIPQLELTAWLKKQDPKH